MNQSIPFPRRALSLPSLRPYTFVIQSNSRSVFKQIHHQIHVLSFQSNTRSSVIPNNVTVPKLFVPITSDPIWNRKGSVPAWPQRCDRHIMRLMVPWWHAEYRKQSIIFERVRYIPYAWCPLSREWLPIEIYSCVRECKDPWSIWPRISKARDRSYGS